MQALPIRQVPDVVTGAIRHRQQGRHQRSHTKLWLPTLKCPAHQHLPRVPARVQKHGRHFSVQRQALGMDVSPAKAAQLGRESLHRGGGHLPYRRHTFLPLQDTAIGHKVVDKADDAV
jgi:hypothetical protein